MAEKIEFLAEYCRLLNENKAQIEEIKVETDVKDSKLSSYLPF